MSFLSYLTKKGFSFKRTKTFKFVYSNKCTSQSTDNLVVGTNCIKINQDLFTMHILELNKLGKLYKELAMHAQLPSKFNDRLESHFTHLCQDIDNRLVFHSKIANDEFFCLNRQPHLIPNLLFEINEDQRHPFAPLNDSTNHAQNLVSIF